MQTLLLITCMQSCEACMKGRVQHFYWNHIWASNTSEGMEMGENCMWANFCQGRTILSARMLVTACPAHQCQIQSSNKLHGWIENKLSSWKMIQPMIIGAHLGLQNYHHTINNTKKQLEQTITPEHTKMLTTTIKITFLKWAGKNPSKANCSN